MGEKSIVLALQEELHCTKEAYQDSSAPPSSALVLPDADLLPQTFIGISLLCSQQPHFIGKLLDLHWVKHTFRQQCATAVCFSQNSEQLQNWRFKCAQRLGRSKPRSSTTRTGEARNPFQPKINYVRESVSKCSLSHPVPPI